MPERARGESEVCGGRDDAVRAQAVSHSHAPNTYITIPHAHASAHLSFPRQVLLCQCECVHLDKPPCDCVRLPAAEDRFLCPAEIIKK